MSFDLAGLAVRRWQFTLVAFALLTMLGLSALMTTPRSEDPQFPFPIVIVRAVLPGAEPTEMEELVAEPLEKRMQELLAIPDRNRSDAEWDELNELEIALASGNRPGAPDPQQQRRSMGVMRDRKSVV